LLFANFFFFSSSMDPQTGFATLCGRLTMDPELRKEKHYAMPVPFMSA
jgi:hypothetical protein